MSQEGLVANNIKQIMKNLRTFFTCVSSLLARPLRSFTDLVHKQTKSHRSGLIACMLSVRLNVVRSVNFSFCLRISLCIMSFRILPASLTRLVVVACPEDNCNIGFSLHTTLLEGESCKARDKLFSKSPSRGYRRVPSLLTTHL